MMVPAGFRNSLKVLPLDCFESIMTDLPLRCSCFFDSEIIDRYQYRYNCLFQSNSNRGLVRSSLQVNPNALMHVRDIAYLP